MRRFMSRDRERGAALVTVIVLGTVMMLLVGAALSSVTSGLRASKTDQDSTGALDAAYSGVQDYLVRFNANSAYYTYGNPASTYSSSTSSTVALPATTNYAFGVNGSSLTSWAYVPDGTTAHASTNACDLTALAACFRYEVDNAGYATSGLLRLRSTGRVGSQTRTIVANIHQQGYTDFIYFTQYEIQDPLISGDDATECQAYLWNGRSSSDCGTIQFASQDTIAGPVHSNDTLTVCGTTFTGAVTTSNPNTPRVITPSGCSAGTYPSSAYPAYSATLDLPASNAAMKTQTSTVTATGSPGCLYTGPTTITLTSDGNMNVVSPWTKVTEMTGTTTGSNANSSYCGSISALNSTAGATVPVPTKNLVYVQSVPTTSTDPNYPSSVPSGLKCYGSGGTTGSALSSSTVLGSATGTAGWWYGTGTSTLRHPLAAEAPADGWDTTSNGSTVWNTTTPAYGCRSGDAYVSGTLKGQLSIAADNYVYATGDISYSSTTTDLLGLVGTNGVIVYNPVNSGGNAMISDSARTIKASILSTAHTFQVQNYAAGGPRGTLTVYGSIAQKYRGPVGLGTATTIADGYAKNYQYDSRLANVGPPYFLTPSISSFEVSQYAGVAAAFSSTGVQTN